MNGAEVQNLIERLRERAAKGEELFQTLLNVKDLDQTLLYREAADALEEQQRCIVAHHELSTLSDLAIRTWAAQHGSECPVCREARQ